MSQIRIMCYSRTGRSAQDPRVGQWPDKKSTRNGGVGSDASMASHRHFPKTCPDGKHSPFSSSHPTPLIAYIPSRFQPRITVDVATICPRFYFTFARKSDVVVSDMEI